MFHTRKRESTWGRGGEFKLRLSSLTAGSSEAGTAFAFIDPEKDRERVRLMEQNAAQNVTIVRRHLVN